jgi:hypothetical protein
MIDLCPQTSLPDPPTHYLTTFDPTLLANAGRTPPPFSFLGSDTSTTSDTIPICPRGTPVQSDTPTVYQSPQTLMIFPTTSQPPVRCDCCQAYIHGVTSLTQCKAEWENPNLPLEWNWEWCQNHACHKCTTWVMTKWNYYDQCLQKILPWPYCKECATQGLHDQYWEYYATWTLPPARGNYNYQPHFPL